MANQQIQEVEQRITSDDNIILEWREGKKAPREMHRPNDAVVDGNMVYFRAAKTRKIYAYNSKNITWTELPECTPDSEWCALAVINNLLTTVGGTGTNKLFSLIGEGQRREWTEVFEPMPAIRSCSAVANTGKALIVAGGKDRNDRRLTTVVIMDIENQEWSSAEDIPKPLHEASAIICNDQIYIVGGIYIYDHDDDGTSKSVYTCTLNGLFLSCQSRSMGKRLAQSLSLTQSEHLAQSQSLRDPLAESVSPTMSIWRPVADLPVVRSTSIAFHGRLLAIGGCDSKKKPPICNIYIYHPINNKWEVISQIKISRSSCFAVVLSTNEIMVMGGYITSTESETDSVEIGRMTNTVECEICCLPLEKVQDWLKCNECHCKIHRHCAGAKNYYEKIKKRETEFLCQYCTLDSLTKEIQALKERNTNVQVLKDEVESMKTNFVTKLRSSTDFEAANKNGGEDNSTSASSRSYTEHRRPKEKVPGSRKIWGTHKSTSTTNVLSTISKLVPETEITIKRKYKLNTEKKIIQWWFVVRGNEEVLCELDKEWEKVSQIRPKWQIMPLFQFSLNNS